MNKKIAAKANTGSLNFCARSNIAFYTIFISFEDYVNQTERRLNLLTRCLKLFLIEKEVSVFPPIR